MVVVIDSRADLAQEKVLMAKLKKYHIGVLLLSIAAVVLLLWAVIATAYNFTGGKHPDHILIEARSKFGKFQNSAAVADSGLCAEIARNVIIQGGNAVDAAIAATFCNGVVVPFASGIGGGGFMVIYQKESKKCTFLNSRETAPAQSTESMYLRDKESAQFGYKSVGIPGEIHGLWTAYQKFGSKVVPWSDLVMPASTLAKGFPMHEAMFKYLDRITKYSEKPEIEPLQSLYTNKFTGQLYKVGEIVSNFPLAKLLRKIAQSTDPVQLFYNGSVAEGIVREMEVNKGIITLEDLQGYRTHVTETLYSDIGGYRMCGPPPPSSWAITQAIPRILEDQYRDKRLFNDAEFYHKLIEAQKLAYGQRGQLGDYLFSPESLQIARNLTDKRVIKELSKRLKDSSQDLQYYLVAAPAVIDAGTAHVSIVDDDGNAVALTSSINTAFGSKMLSKYGFIYNNQMDDFSTPGFRNHWGFEPTAANYIRPGRRPMSSMSPTIVFDPKGGEVRMVTGATGGSKIISATAQTLARAMLMQQTAAEIVEMPRVHNQLTPYETQVEEDFSEHIYEQLEKDYDQEMERTEENLAIVYPITRNPDGSLTAASDFRRRSGNHPAGY